MDLIERLEEGHCRCTSCNKVYTSYQGIRQHLDIVHNEEAGIYQCLLCKENAKELYLKSKQKFRVHLRWKHNTKGKNTVEKYGIRSTYEAWQASKLKLEGKNVDEALRKHNDDACKSNIKQCNIYVNRSTDIETNIYQARSAVDAEKAFRIRYEAGSSNANQSNAHVNGSTDADTYKTNVESAMDMHVKSSTESNMDQKFACDICHYSTSKKHNLFRHKERVHSKQRICEHSYNEYGCLGGQDCPMQAAMINESNEMPRKCSKCSYSSTRKSILSRHIKNVHHILRSHLCDQCAFSCCRESDMLKHKNLIHSQIKAYYCGSCDFVTHVSRGLKNSYSRSYSSTVTKTLRVLPM